MSSTPFLDPAACLLPVPTGTEAAAFDAAAARRGASGAVLMESAGRAAADVAQRLLERAGRRGPVVVAAGAGKNGGDGVVLARTLHARGIPVVLLVDPRRPDPDPLLHGHPVPVHPLPGGGRTEGGDARPGPPRPSDGTGTGTGMGTGLGTDDPGTGTLAPGIPGLPPGTAPALLVDALFGTGLSGAPKAPVAGWIEVLDRWGEGAGTPVLALDLPSGVEGDTGAIPGAVVRAGFTVTFGAPKLGNLLLPGRGVGGRLAVVEMGFPPWPRAAATGALVTGAWARALLPRRRPGDHKNRSGRLLLLAGSQPYGGAAILAARGALRTGVGMLRVACDPIHRQAFLDLLPGVILVDPANPQEVADAADASDAVVAGPGMGTDPGGPLPRALVRVLGRRGSALPLLLDADALTLLARGTLPAWGEGRPVLLTPHPGECLRLLRGRGRAGDRDPEGEADPALDPLSAARAVADEYDATCLLKGTPSVVVGPVPDDGFPLPVLVSASGSTAFARGGMGDVLAGVAGALLARGLAPADAAGVALHLTGRAADRADRGEGLLPEEVAEGVPGVLEELGDGGDPPAPPTAGAPPDPLGLPAVLLELAAPR